MKAIGNFARSSSFQVGALFTSLLTLGVLFVAYFLHLATNQVFLKESQLAIEAELNGLSRLYELHGAQAFDAALMWKTSKTQPDFYYAFISQGSLHPQSDFLIWPDLDPMASKQPVQVNTGQFAQQVIASNPADNAIEIMLKLSTLSDGSQLIVARDVNDLYVAQWVARTFGWLMIATLILISGLSMWVGYYVVDRINRIADTTNRIVQEGRLEERLPIDSSWDDLSQLSVALNRTLDELDQMVQSIKSVSDNVAHDLRTPLTRLRADIEQLKDDDQRTVLLAEVDNIMSIFKGLLRIADVESNKKREAFSTVDLKGILADVIELYLPLAEEKNINIQPFLNGAQIDGDRDLLFQALSNVIDNAIKFTQPEGDVTVTLSTHNRAVSVRICDNGPGIPAQLIDKITQRFFRVESSRHTPGNGLGLAMVNAVMKLHYGEIHFEKNPHGVVSGLCCSLSFPVHEE